MKCLNLGSGKDYRESKHFEFMGGEYDEEWINVDNNKSVLTDVYADINQKLPFEDNTFDLVLASHILEHVDNPVTFLEEIYRVAKKDAKIEILVPHFSHFTAYGDITQKRYFSSYIFKHFEQWKGYYSDKMDFQVEKIRFTSIRIKLKWWHYLYSWLVTPILNISPTITDQFLSKIFLCSEIYFELKVMKGGV